MNSPTPTPQKIIAYWRKNYLFGITRPGVLVFDGANVACYDNGLKPIFSSTKDVISIKEGFGIFKVFVSGKHVSFLTPQGSATSPRPSQQLLDFLQQPATNNNYTVATGAVETLVGNSIANTAPALGAASVGLGVATEAVAVANYVKGQRSLREFLQTTGLLKSK